MNELLIVSGILIVIIALFIKGKIDNNKELNTFLDKCIKEYGKRQIRDYSADEINLIKQYYLMQTAEKDADRIDDITWNDLDMDLLFKTMDKTYSQMGAEVLYSMLRQPKTIERLKWLDELISYFEQEDNKRKECIKILNSIGRMSRISFVSYLNDINDCPVLDNKLHIFCMLFGLTSISLIFVYPLVGFFLMIASLLINVGLYFKERDKTKPYLITFAYVFKLLRYSKDYTKLDIPLLEEKCNRIKEIVNSNIKIKKMSALISYNAETAGHFFDVFADYFRMYFHIDFLAFNYILKYIKKNSESYKFIWEELGTLDACIAIGDYRHSLEYYCKPEFDGNSYCCMDLYHPLLSSPVCNNVDAKRSVLLTGSNASGKSTFLKSVAINALLSQTIYTAVCKKYRAKYYRIITSIAPSDSIENNESYYMAEIKSLKRITDCEKNDKTILCCVDEVLRGTNTAERISASASILESMANKGILTFAATHDLELSSLLLDFYDNYHFTEIIKEESISFPYKLIEGPTKSRNAIKLLSIMGFEEDVVDKADNRCRLFLENNVWK